MFGVFQSFNPTAATHRRLRNLPHWQQPGATYFITFRLADALPQALLAEIRERRNVWLGLHPPPWDNRTAAEYSRRFLHAVQRRLDAGLGLCWLRDPRNSLIVEDTIRHFDGDRYALDAFVVMPNHVHLLVQPAEGILVNDLLRSWKTYSARIINQRMNCRGVFWMDEYFDHAVRRWRHMERFRQYIQNNPKRSNRPEGQYRVGKGMGIREER
jgi:REP element-mobilizing transposase RayT